MVVCVVRGRRHFDAEGILPRERRALVGAAARQPCKNRWDEGPPKLQEPVPKMPKTKPKKEKSPKLEGDEALAATLRGCGTLPRSNLEDMTGLVEDPWRGGEEVGGDGDPHQQGRSGQATQCRLKPDAESPSERGKAQETREVPRLEGLNMKDNHPPIDSMCWHDCRAWLLGQTPRPAYTR